MRHVLNPGDFPHTRRRDLDRRDDFPLLGPGPLGEGAESGAGIYGVVSFCGTAVSPYCLGRDCGIADNRSALIISTRDPADEPVFMVWHRDGEIDVGRPAGGPDAAP